MKRVISLLFHDVYRHQPGESGFSGPGADRYKLSVAAFARQLQSIRGARSDAPVLMTDFPATENGRIPFTITVDDGGLSYYTIIADMLEEYGWRGHCLVTTGQLNQRGFLRGEHVRELHERGHVIGTHTVSHPAGFDRSPWNTLLREWHTSKAILEDITGSRVVTGSVPGGFYAKRVARAARRAGLEVLLTSEPETRMQTVDGCLVAGRFTLRHNAGKDLAGKLVHHDPALMFQEWLVWNGKKFLKNSLGIGGYSRLSNWLAH